MVDEAVEAGEEVIENVTTETVETLEEVEQDINVKIKGEK